MAKGCSLEFENSSKYSLYTSLGQGNHHVHSNKPLGTKGNA